MRGLYRLTFFIWPYSGVERSPSQHQSADEQKSRGAREPSIMVTAESFHHATEQGIAVLVGVRFDERVWECGIKSCIYIGENDG